MELFFGVRIWSFEIVFLLHLLNFLFFLLHVQFLEGFRGLVVEDDEISVADVEAGKMIAGLLRVENVLVDDKRRTCLGITDAEVIGSWQ